MYLTLGRKGRYVSDTGQERTLCILHWAGKDAMYLTLGRKGPYVSDTGQERTLCI